MEQTSAEDTLRLLESSWALDPLTTLKLIGSLRDIKEGKGIRQQYQHCLYWLYQNHPKTLYENLPILLRFGYWKDALHMLIIVCFDGFVHPYFAHDDSGKNQQQNVGKRARKRKTKERVRNQQREIDNRAYNSRIQIFCMAPSNDVSRQEMQQLRLRFAREKFLRNAKYQLFHVRVAQLFAEQLVQDLAGVRKESSRKVSLAAKWAPTLEGHFDRYTLIASTIAVELARMLGKAEILEKPVPVAVYLCRKMYNKEVCIPLREFCQVPEVFMSRNEWGRVQYNRVPAKCMKKNKKLFVQHDKERLEAYLTKDGSKVAGATLKPIEIINSVMSMTDATEEVEKTILEKQWVSLSKDIKAKGKLIVI
jgi:hypothetical protein